MDNYLGKSYLIDGEIWSDFDLTLWKKHKCSLGEHLFDEVLSLDRHYLFCDACEKMDSNVFQEVKPISQMSFFTEMISKGLYKKRTGI